MSDQLEYYLVLAINAFLLFIIAVGMYAGRPTRVAVPRGLPPQKPTQGGSGTLPPPPLLRTSRQVAIGRADAFMEKWFGHRWGEDSHLVNVWVDLLGEFGRAA